MFANDALAAILGLTVDALIGQRLRRLRDPEANPLTFSRLNAAVLAGEPVALRLRLRSASGGVEVAVRGQAVGRGDRAYLLIVEPPAADAAAPQADGERLATLAKLTSDYVYALRVGPDMGWALDWVAGAFTRLTGYETDELRARGGWTGIVHPDDASVVQRRLRRLLLGEEAVVEYRIHTKAGDTRWLRDHGRPQFDAAGELVVAAICSAQDITAQHHAAEELRVGERASGALLTFTGAALCELDAQGRVLKLDAHEDAPLLARLRDGVGALLSDLLDDAAAGTWLDELDRTLVAQEVRRVRLDRPLPGMPAYDVQLSPMAENRVLAALRPALPAPAPGLAEERAAWVSAPQLDRFGGVMLLTLDADLVISAANAAIERLTGWRHAEVIGQTLLDRLVPAGERATVRDALAGLRPADEVELSGSVTASTGDLFPVEWCFTRAADAASNGARYLVTGRRVPPSAGATDADEPRLRAVLDHVADAVITIDERGIVDWFSQAAEAMFGCTAADTRGRHIDLLIAAAGRSRVDTMSLIAGARRNPGEPIEAVGLRQEGGVVAIEFVVSELRVDEAVTLILTVRDITVRKQTEETIRNLAYHDPLTGLPNRTLFEDRLSQAVERARRADQGLAVMILDLDRFKLINDSLGLDKGDDVLRAVAQRLQQTVRRSDTVARLGGDEFLLLLPGTNGAETAAKVAQKLLDAVRPLLSLDEREVTTTASVGIALFPHDGDNPETLVRNADTALYRAKELGRDNCQFYTTDMNSAAFERLVLETQLRKAIENEEFVLVYQPQVRLDTGAVVGVEALVRWEHPELGVISPGEFIPLAEDTGLILPLGQWVLRTACADVNRWRGEGFTELRLAVNFSGRQFAREDMVEAVGEALIDTGFDPAGLELELTESVIMRDVEATIGRLRALHDLGIALAVDDFGTGYSSLNYLKRFPIHALKIDRSFINDITNDVNDAAIAEAIIALAKSLGVKAIAEGVETPEQLATLRKYGCQEMQGYLFSRPLPAGEMLALLRTGRGLDM